MTVVSIICSVIRYRKSPLVVSTPCFVLILIFYEFSMFYAVFVPSYTTFVVFFEDFVFSGFVV